MLSLRLRRNLRRPDHASGLMQAPITMSPKAGISQATIPGGICEPFDYFSHKCYKCSEILGDLTRPVYEYPLNGQWIMMDADDGYILWTGIWKGEATVLCSLAKCHTNRFQQPWAIPKVR